LGQLFTESGYEVVFAEVDRRLVERLNSERSYTLRLVDNAFSQDLAVSPVRAVDGKDRTAVALEIKTADLLATAVGVRALPQVAPVIARGVAYRADARMKAPLNVIICENLRRASEGLRTMCREHLSAEHQSYMVEKVGFVEAVIARMVPILPADLREKDPTFVLVEPYKVLPVDRKGFKGPVPEIVGLHAHTHFAAYVDRKLCLHNAGHAMLGYLGHQKGLEFGYQALEDPQINPLLHQALREAVHGLVREHSLARQDLAAHTADLVRRFGNRALGDTVFRLARDPARKLRPEDRLVGAARLAEKAGVTPEALAWGIAAGFCFDSPDDPLALRLQARIAAKGFPATLAEVSGILADEPLGTLVIERYQRLREGDWSGDGSV
jgi:mannitol-1-phosphate 5-dehydrogenase